MSRRRPSPKNSKHPDGGRPLKGACSKTKVAVDLMKAIPPLLHGLAATLTALASVLAVIAQLYLG